MSRKTFINELGNKIDVAVSEKEIDGVAGVLISLAGPSSDTEVHITRMEAENLLAGLQEIIEPKES